jgi:putative membrane protein
LSIITKKIIGTHFDLNNSNQNNNTMKKLFLAPLLLMSVYFFSSCNSNNSGTQNPADTTSTSIDTAKSMDSLKNNAGTTMIDQKTTDFINDAATGGMMEVELGNMANQKASSQRVKDFGKMMVDDHTKVNDNLKNICSQKNIDLPASITPDQRKDIDKLSKKTGSAFDKEYVNMMVDDHKKDIDAFKKAEMDVNDNDIKTFITNTLPVLQKHLDSIQAIKATM